MNRWWLEKEVWAEIPGYEGHYEVSNMGRVRRMSRASGAVVGKPLKPGYTRNGYPYVNLSVKQDSKKFLVHILVLTTFYGPRPKNHDGDHRNKDRSDARLSNLRWLPQRINRAQGNKSRNRKNIWNT